MKWILFISIFLFSSCLTVRRIEKNCDLFATICLTEKDTVFITKEKITTYRDTIIEYIIKKDTVHWSTPVYIHKGLMNSKLSYLETGLAKSTAQVKSGILKHFLQSGDTILQIKLDNALSEVKTLHTRLEKHQDIITIKENIKFVGFTIKWFWISFFVIVILMAIMIFKNKIFGIFKKIL